MQYFWGRLSNETQLIIEGEESRHLVKSLRKTTGDIVRVIDGSGKIYSGQINEIKRDKVDLHLLSTENGTRNWMGRIHIAIALTKRTDRIEWFIEKSVESGIDELSFIDTQFAERANIRPERVSNIIHSAMKQSGNIFSPIVNYNVPFDKILEASNSKTILFTCGENNLRHFRDYLTEPGSYTFLIGPEGDFSPAEILAAKEKGATIASMGSSRLRTETAGLIALAGFHFAFTPGE
jgi:16S rRNA (uracil1498-N3)-methyltransferase